MDALITNFHLPESTLLMLVSAYAGREKMLNAYKVAVEEVVSGGVREETDSRSMDKIHEDADAEASAAAIKLPHKKKRPAPSYPTQSNANPFQTDGTVSSDRRMTPEEVQAAREEVLRRYSHSSKQGGDDHE